MNAVDSLNSAASLRGSGKKYTQIVDVMDNMRHVVEERFISADGELVLNEEGYAVIRKKYDSTGNIIRVSYFDEHDSPVLVENLGYSSVAITYDENGNNIRTAYFGADGNISENKNGTAIVLKEYNTNHQLIREEYHDPSDKKVIQQSLGCCIIKKEYDDKGNAILETYYDTEDKPLTITAGYAGVRKSYNEQNRLIRTEFLGEDEKPIALANGTAVLCYDYDDARNIISETYLDLSGNQHIIESTNPNTYYAYAEIRMFYNEKNKVVEMEYCNGDNMLANGPEGFAIQTFEYDDLGRQIRTSWFDQARIPYVNSKGYATMSSSYAEDGTKIDTYYDAGGNVIVPH